MIVSATIENFKCFGILELPKLSFVTLVGGENGAGKSAVLEALYLLSSWTKPEAVREVTWRSREPAYRQGPLPGKTLWEPLFHRFDSRRVIRISAMDEGGPEVLSLKFNPRFVPPALKGRRAKALRVGSGQAIPTFHSLDLRSGEGKEQKVAHVVIENGEAALYLENPSALAQGSPAPAILLSAALPLDLEALADRYGRVEAQGGHMLLLKLAKVMEPRLKSLSTLVMGEDTVLCGDMGLGRKVPVHLLGSGLCRYLGLLLAMATCPSGRVLADEVDTGFHHSVLTRMWQGVGRAARELDCQVVATTQRYESVQGAYRGLVQEEGEPLLYLRLDRKGDGNVARVFEPELLGTALESHMEVR